MRTYSDIIDFLRSKHIAVLSTVHHDRSPQSATVFFHLGDVVSPSNFRIYVVTRRHSRKFTNLLSDPKVALVVGTELEPHSVQIEGEAKLMDVSNGVEQLFDLGKMLLADPELGMLYTGAFYPNNPFGQIEGVDYAVFKITPTWIRYMHPDAEAKKIAYTTLLE